MVAQRACKTHASAARGSRTCASLIDNPQSNLSASGSQAAVPDEDEDEAPKPVVVVMGWLGCRRRDLQKYADLYARQGHDVVQYIPSVMTVFAPAAAEGRTRLFIMRMEGRIADGRKTIWALHSNNGAYHFAAVLQQLQEMERSRAKRGQPPQPSRLRESIAGVVFDSAPSVLNVEIMTRGFTGFLAVRSLPCSRLLAARSMLLFCAAGLAPEAACYVRAPCDQLAAAAAVPLAAQDANGHHCAGKLAKSLRCLRLAARSAVIHVRVCVWQELRETLEQEVPARAEQLYLYSAADKLIPIDQVTCCARFLCTFSCFIGVVSRILTDCGVFRAAREQRGAAGQAAARDGSCRSGFHGREQQPCHQRSQQRCQQRCRRPQHHQRQHQQCQQPRSRLLPAAAARSNWPGRAVGVAARQAGRVGAAGAGSRARDLAL